MIMCVILCYPVSFHMLQLLLTGRPILVKDDNRDILIFSPTWSSNTSTVMAILK